MDLNFTYNNMQWTNVFNEHFPIEKSLLSKNEGYFHYTSLNSALKILSLCPEKSDKAHNKNSYISMFASHFLFLNDSEELLNGLQIVNKELNSKTVKANISNYKSIKSIWKNHLTSLSTIEPRKFFNAPNHFIICFCRDGNFLPQWEYYGKECGVSIEFDLDNCCYDGLTPYHNKKPNFPIEIPPRRILYTEADKKRAMKYINNYSIEDKVSADILPLQGIAIASFMKHESFKAEKEVRLLFSPIEFIGIDNNISKELVKFRESDGITKPYMEIHIKHKKEGKHPIKSVTVGPGTNQDIVFNAIVKFMQLNYSSDITKPLRIIRRPSKHIEYVKIDDIEVRRSTIPFRG